MQEKSQHLYSNLDLRKLLIPIIIEQLLSSLMGTADTMMVSNIGAAAISAVSLVDSINILVIQALSALSAGGAILCSQYLGSHNKKEANRSAQQVLFVMVFLSVILSAFCLIFRDPLLSLIFGKVEPDVMSNSQIYFLLTLLSFPFIGIYDAGASIMRSQNNSRNPMIISVISNFLNIGGNAILIFGFGLGVRGAAISTLVSRIFCAVVVMWQLRNNNAPICITNYFSIRPDWSLIKKILFIGIPSGIENSMFQFGKLAIQSTVSTLGTVAIAAQAMTNILENLNGIAAIGIGIGLMTVVGQCLGAGRKDEAIYYIKKLSWLAEAVVITSCLLVFVLTKPITILAGMEPASAKLCLSMITFITIVKPISWVISFIPAYGMRAAGDVKFSMITSCCTMWLCRVSLCVYLCRVWGFGPIAVWIGMFSDWTLRAIVFGIRFHSRKWLNHHVID
ncbi:MAG: MATE family efflux transporter [Lachnospiraceae bacterium]|nr:MATE family efflux transporter [Lachnospiraceae bacterium]